MRRYVDRVTFMSVENLPSNHLIGTRFALRRQCILPPASYLESDHQRHLTNYLHEGHARAIGIPNVVLFNREGAYTLG